MCCAAAQSSIHPLNLRLSPLWEEYSTSAAVNSEGLDVEGCFHDQN